MGISKEQWKRITTRNNGNGQGTMEEDPRKKNDGNEQGTMVGSQQENRGHQQGNEKKNQ